MSAIDELLEDARAKRLGDATYRGSYPYAFEMRVPATEEDKGSVVFVFPLGPDKLTVRRSFAQAVTATLGGVVAEERGVLWHDITVAGNFGLKPKTGYDTTSKAQRTADGFAPIGASEKLSGPLWVRRMLANIFDRYSQLKADPTTAAETVLIWHNFKDEESLVVVPTDVSLDRDTSTRHLYPFSISLKAIGPADAYTLPTETLTGLAAFFAGIKSVIAAVALGLAVVKAGLQEASAFLGEVRYFVATVDALIDTVGQIATAAQDFVDGVKATIATGPGIIDSALAALDELLAVFESVKADIAGIVPADSVPPEVRQTFAGIQDGLISIRAQSAAFVEGYDAATEALAETGRGASEASDEDVDAAAATPPTTAAEAAASTIGAGDRTRRDAGAYPSERAFRRYAGTFPYVVRGGDTVQGLAARFLGAGAYWYDIVIVNALAPPYISWAGGPGIARPGDTILIPRAAGQPATNSAATGATDEALFGRDCRLVETANSRPGRPAVDLYADARTYRDLATIGGVDNLVQAVQLRVWTTRGTMPHAPGYGLPTVVGFGNTGANLTALKVGMRATILQDARVADVLALRATSADDTLEVDVDVLPIGSTAKTTLSTVVA